MTSHDLHPVPSGSPGSSGLPSTEVRTDPGYQTRPPGAGGGGGGLPWRRYLAAFRRFKWLLIASGLLGVGAGAAAYRIVELEYLTQGSLWVRVVERGGQSSGPIAQSPVLESRAWIGLLRSYAVLDTVALEERLFVSYPPASSSLFSGFDINLADYRAGTYRLAVSAGGTQYTIANTDDVVVERGAVGDSVGRSLGFVWAPALEQATAGTNINFTVMAPRDAARSLAGRLVTRMDEGGNFISLELRGRDPNRITSVLRGVMERMVDVAAEQKASQAIASTAILKEQLEQVEDSLQRAELDLEEFRVRTITQPSAESAPVAAGLDETSSSVIDDYHQMRIELDEYERDRERLEQVVAQIPQEGVQIAAFELIPRVRSTSILQSAFDRLQAIESELRTLRLTYFDAYEPIQELLREKEVLEMETVLPAAQGLIQEFRIQERDLENRIADRGVELQQIPPRGIEEDRLVRRRDIADELYGELRQRYETSSLAVASSVPDVRVLDAPSVPLVPETDQRLRLTAMAFMAFVGMGVAVVVLLERMDPRVRHTSDVLDRLGLELVGTVPHVTRGRRGRLENLDDAREAFRELRMRLQYGYGASKQPMLLAITSPAKGEGKTFVTANLAISFAELGVRTLLIDGDTRQGDLHELLQAQRKPGLTDTLTGGDEGPIVQRTAYEHLYFVGSGSRTVSSPDLLNSPRMQDLLAGAKRHYDLILFDCPPLGAGSDAFILGAHAGNVAVVLRTGSTNKEFTLAKLEPFYRLPVRILGAVLNDVRASFEYGPGRYYSTYLPGYEAVSENGEKSVEVALTD